MADPIPTPTPPPGPGPGSTSTESSPRQLTFSLPSIERLPEPPNIEYFQYMNEFNNKMRKNCDEIYKNKFFQDYLKKAFDIKYAPFFLRLFECNYKFSEEEITKILEFCKENKFTLDNKLVKKCLEYAELNEYLDRVKLVYNESNGGKTRKANKKRKSVRKQKRRVRKTARR